MSKLLRSIRKNKKNFFILNIVGILILLVFLLLIFFSFVTANALPCVNNIIQVSLDKNEIKLGEPIVIDVSYDGVQIENKYSLCLINEDNMNEAILYPSEIQDNKIRYIFQAENSNNIGLYTIKDTNLNDLDIVFKNQTNSSTVDYLFRVVSNKNNIEEPFNVSEKGLYNSISNSIDDKESNNRTNSPVVICVDPGHGGYDPGACSHGLEEKDLNLKIGLACRDELQAHRGVQVVMTRDTDTFVSIEDRANIAINNNADFLLSIHNDSAGPSANGSSVWVQNNSAYNNHLHSEGEQIGSLMLNNLTTCLDLKNRGIFTKDSESGYYPSPGGPEDYFGVLRYTRYANKLAAITEHAFVSNDHDADILSKDENLLEMGKQDAFALLKFFNINNPENIIGTYNIVMTGSPNACIDVANSSLEDNAKLQISELNPLSSSQQWRIITDKEGSATIINVNSGKVFDLPGGSSVLGTPVQQYEMNLTDAQKWKFIKNSDDTFSIFSCAGSNRVVDIDSAGGSQPGTKVQIWDNLFGSNQKFKLIAVDSPYKPENISGCFAINCADDNQKVLDVQGASKQDGATVQLYDYNGTDAQKWLIDTDNEGYATIKNLNSGKVLDVAGGLSYPYTNIWQYSSNYSDAQKWKICKNQNGTYSFLPKTNDNIALDVKNGMIESGNTIWTYFYNQSSAQQFNFTNVAIGEVINGRFGIATSNCLTQMLDVAGGSLDNGANIQLYSNNYTEAQEWDIVTDDKGIATIINTKSGRALDLCGAQAQSGNNVWQYEKNNTNAQKWVFKKSGDCYKIVSYIDPNICIDVAGGSIDNYSNIQVYTNNDTNAQKFYLFQQDPLVPPSTATIQEGEYNILSTVNNRYAVDIKDGSKDNAGEIQIWELINNNPNQIFSISKEGDYYRIINIGNNMSVEVDSGHYVPGAKIQQWVTCSANNNQLWAAYEQEDGSVSFRNVSSGLMMDLISANASNGQLLDGYLSNNTAAQKWKLVKPGIIQGHSIMSGATTCIDQMLRFWYSTGHFYPSSVYSSRGAGDINTWCQIAYEEAVMEGVDPAVLFCQAMHETGWLQFGGQVKPEQCNFGGIGATDGGAQGAWFPDVRTGLRAQVQHLKAYGSTDSLVNPCVDPRFNYVTRGCSPTVEQLGGKWASNPNYGLNIVNIMNILYTK